MDTDIPLAQREWLRAELAAAPGPAMVFAHQRLDTTDVHAVASAPEVRAMLEASGKVAAVFQGHSHQNDLRRLSGIPYCTMRAIIEGTGPASSG